MFASIGQGRAKVNHSFAVMVLSYSLLFLFPALTQIAWTFLLLFYPCKVPFFDNTGRIG